MIEHSELLELLDYNQDTGRFFNKVRRGKAKVGQASDIPASKGYLRVIIKNKTYSAHRLAWFYVHGEFPGSIDHINHDRTDNRISNLREASHLDNCRNLGVVKGKSGVVGVRFRAHSQKWEARIKIEGTDLSLGQFDTKEEATVARAKANTLYGFHENHGKQMEVSKFAKLVRPKELKTKQERSLWREIINSYSTEYFNHGDVPLLINYIRAKTLSDNSYETILELGQFIQDEDGKWSSNPAMKTWKESSAVLANLATKLRLAPNGRTRPEDGKQSNRKTKESKTFMPGSDWRDHQRLDA